MRNKLICYVNSIFEGIPDTPEVQELREEILQNTLDRYDEECARGVSETVAYNVAVMSIGDTDELLAAYRKPKKEKKSSRRVCVAIAIALYILCVVPPAVADEMGWPEALGVSLMFLMIAAATALIILSGARAARCAAGAGGFCAGGAKLCGEDPARCAHASVLACCGGTVPCGGLRRLLVCGMGHFHRGRRGRRRHHRYRLHGKGQVRPEKVH